MPKIIVSGLSATIQQTILFDELRLEQVNRASSYRQDASGKAANAARVLNQLEGQCAVLLCPLGMENAALFLALAASDSLEVVSVRVPGKTRFCFTLLEPVSGRTTELVVGEPVSQDAPSLKYFLDASEKILVQLSQLLHSQNNDNESGNDKSGIRALLLAGSRPASFSADLYPRMCRVAKDSGLTVLVDFQGEDLLRTIQTSAPDIIKINEKEFCATFGYEEGLSETVLLESIACESARAGSIIVVTRGANPVLSVADGKVYRTQVSPIHAVNTTGCGDSFGAGFLHEWLASCDISLALREGIRCAALNAANIRPGSIIV